MTTIKTFIKQHPVLAFYVVVFVISWGGFLMVIGPRGLAVVEIPFSSTCSQGSWWPLGCSWCGSTTVPEVCC